MTGSSVRPYILAILVVVAACRPSGPLQVSLATDKVMYRAGEPIELTLRVTNRSSRDTVLQFASGQRYEFQIVDENGATQWTWSADRSFIQMLGSETLPAGKSLEYREEVAARLQFGKYRVIGLCTTTRRPLEASTAIAVR